VRDIVGADKAYDTGDFVRGCRALKVTPHVAQNTSGRSSRIEALNLRRLPKPLAPKPSG
jgi:hypothetical protein